MNRTEIKHNILGLTVKYWTDEAVNIFIKLPDTVKMSAQSMFRQGEDYENRYVPYLVVLIKMEIPNYLDCIETEDFMRCIDVSHRIRLSKGDYVVKEYINAYYTLSIAEIEEFEMSMYSDQEAMIKAKTKAAAESLDYIIQKNAKEKEVKCHLCGNIEKVLDVETCGIDDTMFCDNCHLMMQPYSQRYIRNNEFFANGIYNKRDIKNDKRN